MSAVTLEFVHEAGTWRWENGDRVVEATDASIAAGAVRAVVTVRQAGELVHRSSVKLTSDRERKRFLEVEGIVEGDFPDGILLALEERIRQDGVPGRIESSEGTGTRINFEDPEPWPDSVDGPELLADLDGWIKAHLHLGSHAVRAVALWAVATWFVSELYFAPPLVVQSPTKRAGKTLLLDLLRWIVRRGYLTSGGGVTPAVLFRLNEAWRPTILMDEAERLGGAGADRDLVGFLNNGYRKGGFIARCVEPHWEVVEFDAFGFRALAAIGSLWDTIEDRSVIIRLQRKPRGVAVRRFSARKVEREGRELARRLARFALDQADAVARAEEDTPRPKALDDRACDSWAPLFAVAAVAGGEWPEHALEAALQLSAASRDEGRSEQMIHDLRTIFEEQANPEVIQSGDLTDRLNAIETSPWGDYRKGHGITTHKLAALLRPFEVRPDQRRTSAGSKVRGWWYKDLEPLFTRYPPAEVGQVGQLSNGASSGRFQSGTESGACTTSRSAENRCGSSNVPVVPVQERGREGVHRPPPPDEDPEGFERWAIQHETQEIHPEPVPDLFGGDD